MFATRDVCDPVLVSGGGNPVGLVDGNSSLLIGQIVTDEELRGRFLRQPLETLNALRDQGVELTEYEIDEVSTNLATNALSNPGRVGIRADAVGKSGELV